MADNLIGAALAGQQGGASTEQGTGQQGMQSPATAEQNQPQVNYVISDVIETLSGRFMVCFGCGKVVFIRE